MGKFDRILTQVNDYHIPCAMGIFGVGTVLQWFHHLDASYVAFTTTVLGFIGGHAWIKSKNGDDDSATGGDDHAKP